MVSTQEHCTEYVLSLFRHVHLFATLWTVSPPGSSVHGDFPGVEFFVVFGILEVVFDLFVGVAGVQHAIDERDVVDHEIDGRKLFLEPPLIIQDIILDVLSKSDQPLKPGDRRAGMVLAGLRWLERDVDGGAWAPRPKSEA